MAIQIRNSTTAATLFVLDDNQVVRLDFYFSPDDPRNGAYEAVLQNGLVTGGEQTKVLSFSGIPYSTGDELTFIATEVMTDSVVNDYKFYNGVYFPKEDPVTPVTTCPFAINCALRFFSISFNPEDFTVLPEHSTVPVTFFFGAGSPYNRYYWIHSVDPTANKFIFYGLGQTLCESLFQGEVTITIGDMVCQFNNGVLISSNCSQMDPYYGNTCMQLLEGCQAELIRTISNNADWILCKQWNDFGRPCNTEYPICRYGKTSIGTEGAANAMLTVKNGVITDKVFVSFCGNGGWCDYVFEPSYHLMPLSNVEQYIQTNKHLPNMPSSKEIETAGSFELGDITFRQQEKIEEIFLHLIAMEKEVSDLEAVSSVLEMRYRLNMQ